MKTGFEFRDYQKTAIEAFLAAGGKATIQAAPGSGKTVIALAAAERVGARKILVVTITIDLCLQWKRMAAEHGFENVTVITYAKASRLVENEAFWKTFDFIILDESHHLQEGPAFRRILVPIFQAPYALGLSATPPTDPENLSLRVLPVVYEYTLAESTDEGYAAPLEVRPLPVELNADERARYDMLTKKIRDAIAQWGADRYHSKPCDVDPVTGARIYGGQLTTERKQLLAHTTEKFRTLVQVIKGINVEESPTRIFVWSEYVESLEEAERELTDAGIAAIVMTGKTPKKLRGEILCNYWGTTFEVLLVAKVGEEGLDVPECAHGIIIAGAKTSRQNVQRIGRLLRPMPGKVAKLWLIFAERTTEENLLRMIDRVTDV